MKPVHLSEIRRVLVIKWSALGDVVIASALMEDVARAFPSAEIDLNTQPNCAGLFAHDPRFSEVWAIDVRSKTRRWANSLAWIKKVRQGRYDLVIDLQASDHSRLLLALLWLTGGAPRVRIGNRGGFPYTHQPAIRKSGAHALPMMQSVLESIGIPARTTRPVLHPPPERLAAVDALRSRHGLGDGDYVVLLPGSNASGKLKRWGAARFAELARLLHAEGVAKIVVIGGPDEVDECEEIARAGDYVLNLNGQLQLFDIAPLCSGASAIVGNDTGTAHFASAAGRPLLVICGPTDPRRVKPIGAGTVAVQAVLPCINCYAKTCRNPDFHACMKTITPAWIAARMPELDAGELAAGRDWPEGLRSF
ncbi:glycosyltransferase family 9 protein [Thiobacillus denitrificans]|uniref:glycosyltransferase family 9 protein n=1 Tax=Thiobacillus denitrificans TaxID=36861 RepID=UPI0000463914|nr:glycosyltransferase family 9 protein [Thiobacillus denitrificans]